MKIRNRQILFRTHHSCKKCQTANWSNLKIKTDISVSLARISISLDLITWDFTRLHLYEFFYDPVDILKNPKIEIRKK